MRISDWSSDVCSSDLVAELRGRAGEPGLQALEPAALLLFGTVAHAAGESCWSRGSPTRASPSRPVIAAATTAPTSPCGRSTGAQVSLRPSRSESRRVGKERVGHGKSRVSPDPKKTKKKLT